MTRPFDAIVFDAFGTLVHIGQPTRPYAQARQALEGRDRKSTRLLQSQR